MKKEFVIEDEWLPYEIHPDTPRAGVLWEDYFPGMDARGFFRQLDQRGRTMGVRFGPQPLMSNSHDALEGGEFAKAFRRYDAYHEGVFRAFFTDCQDIGDRSVLLAVARSVGLDAAALDSALQAGTYRSRLEEVTRMARGRGISAAPTFVIERFQTISGAQPIETFRTTLRNLLTGGGERLTG